jgi:hypothetical protein
VATIHDRMPAILDKKHFSRWFSDEGDPRDLLVSYPSDAGGKGDWQAAEIGPLFQQPGKRATPLNLEVLKNRRAALGHSPATTGTLIFALQWY